MGRLAGTTRCGLLLVGGLVLLVGDRFEPGGAVSSGDALEHGEVAHEVAGGGSVPVFLAGRGVDGVAGALSDRIGARRAFGAGLAVFVLASAGCGLAPAIGALIGAVLTPFSARIAERLGAKALITAGLILMTAGLVILAVVPASAPVQALAAPMVLTGLAGPLVMPPVTAVLLNCVPAHRAGTASGVFNTSRQIGGALAVAVFGGLLANRASFLHGVHASLLLIGQPESV